MFGTDSSALSWIKRLSDLLKTIESDPLSANINRALCTGRLYRSKSSYTIIHCTKCNIITCVITRPHRMHGTDCYCYKYNSRSFATDASFFIAITQGGYIFYAGASLAGASYCRQCRRRPAILPLQLRQGCQVCVKISAQRLPRVAQFNAC